MNAVLRLVVAFLPVALAPLLLVLLAQGTITFGGGEKDLVWVIPWTLGAVVFAATSLALWAKGVRLRRSAAVSAVAALVGVLVFAGVLALRGKLGIAGRF